ncbi:MAG: TIGR01906 family membrane protein [Clostridiales bacterium]|nr:TIGR01906 family membrane protein [Clostridiales bacterium]
MRKFFFVVYILFGIFLSLALLLTVVDRVSFNTEYYLDSFVKNDIPSITGMDMENLEITITDLIEYLTDEREFLDTVAIVQGEEREVFGERAVLHMVDVKHLFIAGRYIRNFSALAILSLILIAYRFDAKKREFWANIRKTTYLTTVINILFICVILAMTYFDFNRYFTYFHHIFFANDLWLLDPSHEVLIQMLPLSFFISTTIRIVVYYMGILILLSSGNRIFDLIRKKRIAKYNQH